jgi:protein TonB
MSLNRSANPIDHCQPSGNRKVMKIRVTLMLRRVLPILLFATGLQLALAQQTEPPKVNDPAALFADFTLVRSKNVPPKYPRRAVQQGREGWVDLGVTVNPDGTVANVIVLEAEPKRVFERPAIRAAKQWEFEAPSASGVDVALTRKFRVSFQLVD